MTAPSAQRLGRLGPDTRSAAVQYYDDAAGILRSIILSAIAPHRLATAPPQQLVQSPSQEERASHDFAERQATEELPNFLPYAAVDSTDEFEDRCACIAFTARGKLVTCGTPLIPWTIAVPPRSCPTFCPTRLSTAPTRSRTGARVLIWRPLAGSLCVTSL